MQTIISNSLILFVYIVSSASMNSKLLRVKKSQSSDLLLRLKSTGISESGPCRRQRHHRWQLISRYNHIDFLVFLFQSLLMCTAHTVFKNYAHTRSAGRHLASPAKTRLRNTVEIFFLLLLLL